MARPQLTCNSVPTPGLWLDSLLPQESPHVHSSAIRDGYVYVADLGTDAVYSYSLNAAATTETPARPLLSLASRLDVTPSGSGPRSLALHPSAPLAVVTLEMAAKLLLVRLEGDGRLNPLQYMELNPEGWPSASGDGSSPFAAFNNGKWASDVVWGRDGRFLYAASRLIDSIVCFALKDERLSFVQRIPAGGKTPRQLCISPDGTLLLACLQHGHCVSSFAVDTATGFLRAVDSARVPLPSCIVMHEL